MKALRYHGKKDMRCDSGVPDPKIEHPRDAILKVRRCAICGSDLHLFNSFWPTMKKHDIVGHEFMGEVVEVGSENKNLKVGDRVVVPFNIFCGECEQCQRGNFSVCERTNPNAKMQSDVLGHQTAAMYGYSHLTGGIPGGQAEYVRLPFADVGPVKIPETMSDEHALFLGDIILTGWQAALQCDIQPTDVVAIWGAGPVRQFALTSAIIQGAKTVIVIDKIPERLALASAAGALTINYKNEKVVERLNDLTEGRGPDKCIDAVGMEADPSRSIDSRYDRIKQAMFLVNDRIHVLREMAYVCRPAGTLSVPGVYSGLSDKFPFGMIMNKGLKIRTGQTDVGKYVHELMRMVEEGVIDPTRIITHRVSLEQGPEMYKMFNDKADNCIKVVMKP